MVFRPILKERVWGGRWLEARGKRLPPNTPIGESWEIADLPPEIEEGQSVIANGPWQGRTLRQVIAEEAEMILGAALNERSKADSEQRFPLLIKYLDAQENLSVQVHPDRTYAAHHPEAHLKDEAWVVIDHKPGAVIYKGLRGGLDERTLRAHIESGEIVNDLRAIEVKTGECHYLTSGTVHALGAGVLVAEIQTPSDTTFRMYDWGRTSREMHIDQAMEVIFGSTSQSPKTPRPEHQRSDAPLTVNHLHTTFLLEADRFNVERIEALEAGRLEVATNDLPEVWMILEGGGEITGKVNVDLTKGTTVLVPASIEEPSAMLRKGTTLLRVTLPSPLRGMVA